MRVVGRCTRRHRAPLVSSTPCRRCRRPRPSRSRRRPSRVPGSPVGRIDALGREHHARCRCRARSWSVCSYQTTHGTVSLSAGERDVGLDAVAAWGRRSGSGRRPVQPLDAGLLEAEAADRRMRRRPAFVPDRGSRCVPGPIGFDTKIWSWRSRRASFSCQVTHGPGLVGSAAEPPATDGFSAVLVRCGCSATGPRVRCRRCHGPGRRRSTCCCAASKRLAKMFVRAEAGAGRSARTR